MVKASRKDSLRAVSNGTIQIWKKNLIPNIGVNHANYLDGGLSINRDGEYWLVYHSERNQKSRLCLFESPYDAANFYLWNVLSNPKKENTSIGRIPKLGTF